MAAKTFGSTYAQKTSTQLGGVQQMENLLYHRNVSITTSTASKYVNK